MKKENIYYLSDMNKVNKSKKYLSYCFISFSNMNYEKYNDEKKKNIYTEINMIILMKIKSKVLKNW